MPGASDLAELSVCLSVASVPVIWQNCVYGVEEHASDLAEYPVY